MVSRQDSKVSVLFVSAVPEFVGGAENSLMDLVANPRIHAIVAAPGQGSLLDRARQLGADTCTFSYGAIAAVHRPFRFSALIAALRDSVRLAGELSRLARRHHADLIHSNGLKVHVVACLARLFGAPPVFVHVRDVPLTGPEKLVWRLLQVLATRVILVSRACWPWPRLPGHARVIHNGIAASTAALPGRQPGTPLTIGYLGRVTPLKGLKLLVGWLAACRDRGLAVRLIVRGSRYPRDAAYIAEVDAEIAHHGLGDLCRFEGERRGLAAIYEGLDVVAVPSDIPDPLPRVVMEGLSLGIPVIGYPAGGIPDMIEDGLTGYLVRSADEFVHALADLIGTPGKYEAVRQAGHAWVIAHMTLDALYRNIDREYEAVAGRPAAPALVTSSPAGSHQHD